MKGIFNIEKGRKKRNYNELRNTLFNIEGKEEINLVNNSSKKYIEKNKNYALNIN